MLTPQGSEVLETEQGPMRACYYYRIGYVLRMARRSKDWNEGLAHDLQNARFARAFLIAAVDEGVPLKEALKIGVTAMTPSAPRTVSSAACNFGAGKPVSM